MKRALLFPGQGSQALGMGKDLYNNFPVAKHVFNEVNEALSQKLTDLMFADDKEKEEDLKKTKNAQPAIMACSVAVVEILKSEIGDLSQHFSYLAGHSLGEYSALYTGGVFDISTVAKLLRVRGEAMEEASPEGVGAMAAIIGITDYNQVEKLIIDTKEQNEICIIANDNTDGQVVISGNTKSVNNAVAVAKEYGAKMAKILPVSGAFHSPLMLKAAEKLSKALDDLSFNEMSIPIISNVQADIITNKENIKPLLVEQITGRVRWRETMSFLHNNSVDAFVEAGWSNVLTGLAKRAYPGIQLVNLNTKESIENFVDSLR